KSFHLSSSSLNGFVLAGTAAGLIYHNRNGITACQENLSIGVFRSRRRFIAGRRPIVNHCPSTVRNRQLSGISIAPALNRGRKLSGGIGGIFQDGGRRERYTARRSLPTMAGVRQSAPDESHHRR